MYYNQNNKDEHTIRLFLNKIYLLNLNNQLEAFYVHAIYFYC
jgi:hypothetical protein